MGSMLQVLELPRPQMYLGDILSVHTGGQQVKVTEHRHGKFFGSKVDMQRAWDRFLDLNDGLIVRVNHNRKTVFMQDGSRHSFHAVERYEDVYHVAGAEFCVLDVDLDITDEKALWYIKTRLRCIH